MHRGIRGQVINPSKWNDKPTILWMMVLTVDGGSCGVLCSGGVRRSCRSLPVLWRRGMTKNNKNFLDNIEHGRSLCFCCRQEQQGPTRISWPSTRHPRCCIVCCRMSQQTRPKEFQAAAPLLFLSAPAVVRMRMATRPICRSVHVSS